MIEKFSALKIYLGNGKWITNGVIEKQNGNIKKIYSLQECQSEPSHTTFYNGIITPELNSINKNELREHFLLKQEKGFSFQRIFDELFVEKNGQTDAFLLWEMIELNPLKVTENTIIQTI